MPNPAATRTLSDIVLEAETLAQQQLFQKALEVLHEGRPLLTPEVKPADEAPWHYGLGQSLLGVQRALEAASAFRRSAELFDTAGDWDKKGLSLEQAAGAYYTRRAYREALEQYRSALAVYQAHGAKSQMGRAWRGIGNVQVDTQDKHSAVNSFRAARKLYQECGDEEGLALAVMNLASLVFEKEGQQGAIREYRQCVEQEGCKHHLAYNNLGFLLTLEQQAEEALTWLQKAEVDLNERGVNDEDGGLVHLNLGNVMALLGRHEEAEKHLSKALAHFKSEGPARAIELVVLANAAHRSEGFEPFMVTDDGLKESVARLTLAAVRVAQGRVKDALQEASQAGSLDPQMAYVHAATGWIHLADQNNEAATTALRRAAGKEPNNAQVRKAVDLANPYMNAKVGRNDACPCGSGKKFKKCHGVA